VEVVTVDVSVQHGSMTVSGLNATGGGTSLVNGRGVDNASEGPSERAPFERDCVLE